MVHFNRLSVLQQWDYSIRAINPLEKRQLIIVIENEMESGWLSENLR